MAKVRNISGSDLIVPELGGRLVVKGQVVEVPDDASFGGFTQADGVWAPADDVATTKHEEGRKVFVEAAAIAGDLEHQPPQPPAGNAPAEAWAAYALASGQATPEDVEGVGRDTLRDTYGPRADDPTPGR